MTLIIAEAGVNHNGDKKIAIELVKAAHRAGADIVKFQTFKAKNLVTEDAQQADYQVENTQKKESQLNMLERLELSFEAHKELVSLCNKLDIEFLSTAFDFESLEFLVNDLGLTRLKIPSGELTNAPLVLAHAQTQCDLIVSTGMASLAEIEQALSVIAFGYTADPGTKPTELEFHKAYVSNSGQAALRSKVTILHCTSEYPAPFDEINLSAMNSLGQSFGLSAGYSDHSQGVAVPIAAAALGAKLIEKHFTLDKNMVGPDHKASLDPNELRLMVASIREVELSLGDGVKIPTVSELKNKSIARKSIVAACPILKGDVIDESSMAIKRPAGGMSPYEYWGLIGKPASRDYALGELICE